MSMCVIYCTNSHLFKGGVFDMLAQRQLFQEINECNKSGMLNVQGVKRNSFTWQGWLKIFKKLNVVKNYHCKHGDVS